MRCRKSCGRSSALQWLTIRLFHSAFFQIVRIIFNNRVLIAPVEAMLVSPNRSRNSPVAVLYQAQKPPIINGIAKPMKPGGYSDSGADIAFALQQAGVPIVTPVREPGATQPFDWVFADTPAGISQAVESGAQILWLNTILYRHHPVEQYLDQKGWVVGQLPDNVEKYDDKWHTNQLLKSQGLPIPKAVIVEVADQDNLFRALPTDFTFPLIVKPVRGRGSAGVVLVDSQQQLISVLADMFDSLVYGEAVILEEYLPG